MCRIAPGIPPNPVENWCSPVAPPPIGPQVAHRYQIAPGIHPNRGSTAEQVCVARGAPQKWPPKVALPCSPCCRRSRTWPRLPDHSLSGDASMCIATDSCGCGLSSLRSRPGGADSGPPRRTRPRLPGTPRRPWPRRSQRPPSASTGQRATRKRPPRRSRTVDCFSVTGDTAGHVRQRGLVPQVWGRAPLRPLPSCLCRPWARQPAPAGATSARPAVWLASCRGAGRASPAVASPLRAPRPRARTQRTQLAPLVAPLRQGPWQLV